MRWLPLLLAASALPLLACQSTPTGDPCPDGGACGSGLTCQGGQDFPVSVCTEGCSLTDDTCPGGSLCAPLASGNFCLRTCSSNADCNASQLCSSVNRSGKVCAPRVVSSSSSVATCSAPTVVMGGVAGPATEPASCFNSPVQSALPVSQTVDLGVHHTGDTLSFTVPQGASAFSLIMQGLDPTLSVQYQGEPLENVVLPLQILTPASAVYYDETLDEPSDPSTALSVYRDFSGGSAVFEAPSTSTSLAQVLDGGLQAGTWSFTLDDFADACTAPGSGCDGGTTANTYQVNVWVRPTAAAATGTMDVAFYWVSQDMHASAAAASAAVQRMLSSYESFYAAAGICIGQITFYDVPAWAQTKYASSIDVDDQNDPCSSDLNQLFTLGMPGTQVNLFMVDALISETGAANTKVVGQDGTIPGPTGFGGSVNAGAAVSIADLGTGSCGTGISVASCGADVTAYIAAHETGHWLGLNHTSERNGETFDPLTDTGQCRCEACTSTAGAKKCSTDLNSDSATIVTNTNCTQSEQNCGGGENLMFWLVDTPSTGAVSAQQGQLMRLNPAVQ